MNEIIDSGYEKSLRPGDSRRIEIVTHRGQGETKRKIEFAPGEYFAGIEFYLPDGSRLRVMAYAEDIAVTSMTPEPLTIYPVSRSTVRIGDDRERQPMSR